MLLNWVCINLSTNKVSVDSTFRLLSTLLLVTIRYTCQRVNKPPQNKSTKLKKLWFGPMQLCLSAHVLHFFKIMSNTLMIFVTHFSYSLNIIESKKKIPCTSSMDKHLKIGAQNRKNYDLDTLKIIMDVCCISYQGKITVQVGKTL